MNDALIQVMNKMPPHALSVFLFLEHRSRLDTKIGVTQQEVSRATGYSVDRVREALGWLERPPPITMAALKVAPELPPFVAVTAFSKAHKITLLEPYVVPERWVRFTFEDTDSRRIGVLENELRRLATKSRQTSRLALAIQGKPQQVIAQMEGDLGRPLTNEESYLLGAMIGQFGPERVKQAWNRHAADMDDPMRGLYAMFMNKYFGKRAEPSPEKDTEVAYQKITRDDQLL